MIKFPESTVFSKNIPVEILIKKAKASVDQCSLISKEIVTIMWKYKLSAETLNINPGVCVSEIEFLEIELKSRNISTDTLRIIDGSIPYQIIYMLTNEDQARLFISYKTIKKNSNKVEKYFSTPWKSMNEVNLSIIGTDMDRVYESFFSQISNMIDVSKYSLSEAFEISLQREKLESEIKVLQNKIKKEKQYNNQVKLLSEIRDIQEKLKNLY